MSIQAVSRNHHAALRWQRYAGYGFVAGTVLAPLAAVELAQATLALPLALVERDGHWTINAVLGLQPGQNLFVDANGAWLGGYVPASFRGHPFLIGAKPGGEPTLCVDDGSGLVTEGPEGEPFFEADGQLSPALTQVLGFLQATAESEDIAVAACEQLVRAGVVEAWPITLQSDAGPQSVTGLYRVNETALNALDASTFADLRHRGALGLAYAQLLATAHLSRLGQLAQARAQAEAAERARAQVKPLLELPLNSDATWDWSKVGR